MESTEAWLSMMAPELLRTCKDVLSYMDSLKFSNHKSDRDRVLELGSAFGHIKRILKNTIRKAEAK